MIFQDLAHFCTSNYNNMAVGPSVAIWITLSPVFLFIYYVKSLPRGCGVILQGHLHLRMSLTLSMEFFFQTCQNTVKKRNHQKLKHLSFLLYKVVTESVR